MTRFARAGKRKFVEASSWNDLSKGVSNVTESESSKEKTMPVPRKKIEKFPKKDEEFPVDPKRQKKIEARRLRRKMSKCCFICRQPGHQAAECSNKDDMKIGNCFKCGSTNHTTRNCKSVNYLDKSSGAFPFAKCFICQEMGHLAKSCPENPRGLYPQGGGCKMCGSVEHLKRDCPQIQKSKRSKGQTLDTISLTKVQNTEHLSADGQEERSATDSKARGKLQKTRKNHTIVKF